MKRLFSMLGAIALLITFAAPLAAAHVNSPDFSSEIDPLPEDGITAGVSLSIAAGSDHVRLENDSGKTIFVLGEEGEPYLRFLGEGGVDVNVNSFTYRKAEGLESAHEGETGHEHGHEEEAADDSGPDWQPAEEAGLNAAEWRDPRVRYLGEGVPPQVIDESQETKISEYVIPLEVAGDTYEARGILTWKGDEEGSSTLPLIVLGVIFVVAVAGALVIRRRRGEAET